MSLLNETHDPALRSWVAAAQAEGCDFTLQNLPHGVFRERAAQDGWRGGVAIGDQLLDLQAVAARGLLAAELAGPLQAAAAPTLNGFMAMGPAAWSLLRLALSRLLREDAPAPAALRECLRPLHAVEMDLPARVGDFTDFFTSYTHMVNAGRIFNPDAPPMPNFRWLPIAYHGRSSSVVVSGTPVRRPLGQSKAPDAAAPGFGPSRRLDYELELGAWVGPGNALGQPIPVAQAEQHVFGLTLLNDWSARDIQGWEAVPLGPFLAKNFLTTVSPWVVTLEALAPFRCRREAAADEPPTLPYLRLAADQSAAFDVRIEAWLQPAGAPSTRLSHSSWRHGQWALAQMVAHHTIGGCNLQPGDLLGTGTQSGPGPGEQGCLLELTQGGRVPLTLPDGQRRGFLEDGDRVELKAWAEAPGRPRVGFGACVGTVLPAHEFAVPAD